MSKSIKGTGLNQHKYRSDYCEWGNSREYQGFNFLIQFKNCIRVEDAIGRSLYIRRVDALC